MWEAEETMKKQTEEALKTMPMAMMKNYNGSKGVASYRDGQYTLIDLSNDKAQYIYKSVDKMWQAGWSVD